MNAKPFASGLSENAVTITRVADRRWHALDDDLVVSRGHGSEISVEIGPAVRDIASLG